MSRSGAPAPDKKLSNRCRKRRASDLRNYDNAGRLTWRLPKGTSDTTHFEYAVDGQLVKAHNDDIELQFAYDGIGNRIRKIIIENNDTTIVKYTYDGADLLFEKDDNDAAQIRYLYGPGIDHILESVDSVGTKQHFADALGSVTRITDSTGTRYKLMVYDSYGNMTSDTGSVQADYISYTGREAERDLNIYYYRARYYDPLTGRFMVRDPIGLTAGDVNLYRYVGNNPVSLRDPSGMISGVGVGIGLRNLLMDILNSIANASTADCNGEFWWDKLEKGYYYGTGFGEEAVDWWAERYNQSDNIFTDIFYGAGGLTASLWTEDTWMGTGTALALAGLGQVSGLAGRGTWLGGIEFHAPHLGGPHQYYHVQFMLRIGEHLTKIWHWRLW